MQVEWSSIDCRICHQSSVICCRSTSVRHTLCYTMLTTLMSSQTERADSWRRLLPSHTTGRACWEGWGLLPYFHLTGTCTKSLSVCMASAAGWITTCITGQHYKTASFTLSRYVSPCIWQHYAENNWLITSCTLCKMHLSIIILPCR